jgi:hypothetical protein
MSNSLVDIEIQRSNRPIPPEMLKFLEDGRSRFQSVDVFGFVPSNYENLWSVLDSLPRGRFCEWGSGFGIATGLAAWLGFDAVGFENQADLVNASRKLLADHGIEATIEHADYHDYKINANIFYVYCWPGQIMNTEEHFIETAPQDARLLICYGQNDLRCKMKAIPDEPS